MSTWVNGHTLTPAELRVRNAVQDFCEERQGEWFTPRDVFPEHNNRATADRRTVDRLCKLRVIGVGDWELTWQHGVPSFRIKPGSVAPRQRQLPE